jgi:hypothetical protein
VNAVLGKRISNRRLLAVAAFAAGFQLTATAPASLATAFSGGRLTVAKASGTLWNGRLSDARLNGVALGEVVFSVDGLSLFTLGPTAHLRLDGGALGGEGRVRASFGGLSVFDARLEFDLAAAGRYAFLGAPLEGKVRATVRELKLNRSGCAAADIDVWTDVLAAPARRLDGAPLDLSGGASCADGALLADLSGESADGSARLNLAVAPDMTYTLDAAAEPARAEIAEALRVFGFREGEGAMSLAMSGVLRAKS